MVGKLINKFDNIEHTTVKTFNTLFRNVLSEPKSYEVTIGSPLSGDKREILVGSNRYSMELAPRVPESKVDVVSYELYENGKIQGMFDTAAKLANYMGISVSAVVGRARSGTLYQGFLIKKIITKMKKEERKVIYTKNKVTEQMKSYEISKNNITIGFRFIKDIVVYLNTYEWKVIMSIKENTELDGYKINARFLTKEEITRIKTLMTGKDNGNN